MESKHSLVFFTLIELSKILSLYYFLILFYSQSISSLFLCVSIFSQIHCKTHPTVTAHTHYYQPPLPTPNHQNHKQKQTQNRITNPKSNHKTHTHPPLTTTGPPQTIPIQNQITQWRRQKFIFEGAIYNLFSWVWNVK